MGATQTRLADRERPTDHRPGRVLLEAYRDAFRQFQHEARNLAEIKARSSHDPAEAERALLRVEHARLAYNDLRDQVAASLMSPESSRKFSQIPSSTLRGDAHVKNIAELLWELAGRPQGSADDDWYRAERVVRASTVSAACDL